MANKNNETVSEVVAGILEDEREELVPEGDDVSAWLSFEAECDEAQANDSEAQARLDAYWAEMAAVAS